MRPIFSFLSTTHQPLWARAEGLFLTPKVSFWSCLFPLLYLATCVLQLPPVVSLLYRELQKVTSFYITWNYFGIINEVS